MREIITDILIGGVVFSGFTLWVFLMSACWLLIRDLWNKPS